jgi:hypothetical protein
MVYLDKPSPSPLPVKGEATIPRAPRSIRSFNVTDNRREPPHFYRQKIRDCIRVAALLRERVLRFA